MQCDFMCFNKQMCMIAFFWTLLPVRSSDILHISHAMDTRSTYSLAGQLGRGRAERGAVFVLEQVVDVAEGDDGGRDRGDGVADVGQKERVAGVEQARVVDENSDVQEPEGREQEHEDEEGDAAETGAEAGRGAGGRGARHGRGAL